GMGAANLRRRRIPQAGARDRGDGRCGAGRLHRRTRSESEVQVSTAASGPVPYRVVYSERVRQRLLALADVARERGDGDAFVAAVKEFHRRLCLYPQFGEPLLDLTQELGQVWIGTVRPLAMRYGVLEEKRLVMVAALPVLLPKSEPEQSA